VCLKRRSGIYCSFCALEQHIRRALDPTRGVIHPSSIVQNLKQLSKSFRQGQQEDSHEFLLRLTESCLLSSKGLSGSSRLLESLFNGKFRSRITCQRCGSHSDCFDPFMDVSLDVAACNSLEDCLKRFTAVEILQGVNLYKCKNCDIKVVAHKQFSIHQLPAVLTVQLKRFDVTRNRAGKIHRRISFPESLRLGSYLSIRDDDIAYSLVGVVVHIGSSLSSGHYVAFCRGPNGFWYKCDDECVTQVKLETVLSEMSGAYLLFYERAFSPVNPKHVIAEEVTRLIAEPAITVSRVKEAERLPSRKLISLALIYFRPLRNRAFKSRRLHILFMSLIRRRRVNKYAISKLRAVTHSPGSIGLFIPSPATCIDHVSKPPATRIEEAMSASSQWGPCQVSAWDDEDQVTKIDSRGFETAQRILQPLPIRRSQYDVDYDSSKKLKHNARNKSQINSQFSGSRIFDHAQNYMGSNRPATRGRRSDDAAGRSRFDSNRNLIR